MKAKTSLLGRHLFRASLASCVFLLLGGCTTLKRAATNQVADVLAAGGTTFSSDDDPELVKQAVPFSLKLMESVLSETPKHQGLLLAASKGFTQYGYAFVQEEADELEARDFAGAEALRARAKKLYFRARDYGLRGLEVGHPGFTALLASEPRKAAALATKKDVPLLYWTAAAWGAAMSVGKDDPDLLSQIPRLEALIDRAAALDEAWDEGALHSFLIQYELTRQGVSGDPFARARTHFDRAVELARGRQAGPFVTYAEAVCVEKQNLALFEKYLNQALAVNPDAVPELRLTNLVMQRRARWLLSRKDELFLNPSSTATP